MEPTSKVPDFKSLEEAKAFLRLHLDGPGAKCPCCKQTVKRYKRPLTSSMAYVLILLYKKKGNMLEYIHVENYLKEQKCPVSFRGDFHKLKYWGLIEPKPGSREDGNPSNGFYRISLRGCNFLMGQMIPASVKVYNGQVYGFDERLISINQALGKKFNYSELMGKALDEFFPYHTINMYMKPETT